MWTPKTEDEILNGIQTLEESDTLEFKSQPNKADKIAISISALANSAGGTIVYGIGEDEHGHTGIATPFAIKGVAESIDNISKTSISEVPSGIRIVTIQSANDPSLGYICVQVPPSARAPHMVIIKGESRYYGRSAKTNRILGEHDVARLYEKRRTTLESIKPFLDDVVQKSEATSKAHNVRLHIAIRPVLLDELILERSLPKTDPAPEGTPPSLNFRQESQKLFRDIINRASSSEVFPRKYEPDLIFMDKWSVEPEGFRLEFDGNNPPYEFRYQINFDGSAFLFCSGVSRPTHEKSKMIKTIAIAGISTRFIFVLGQLYGKASYLGKIDIGVELSNLSGAVASSEYGAERALSYDRFQRTGRFDASELNETPRAIARSLLRYLTDAILQGISDPFDLK